METAETTRLREGIRTADIVCPEQGDRCDLNVGAHAPDCHWAWAVLQIYELERDLEARLL